MLSICSIAIQESARTKLDAKLRIGIHLGDVTIEDNDVYGDGMSVLPGNKSEDKKPVGVAIHADTYQEDVTTGTNAGIR